MMQLPSFRYHPDPIATGSITRAETPCRACNQVRGYIYTGPVYAEEALDGALCPWCIADGTAHARFAAAFVDMAGIGGYGEWDAVPVPIVEEVAYHTPGFSGWQQERWWTHCADAAVFIAVVGRDELATYGLQAIAAIQRDVGYSGKEWEDYYQALDREHGPTAYLFHCVHCGAIGGYSDCH